MHIPLKIQQQYFVYLLQSSIYNINSRNKKTSFTLQATVL